MTIRALFLCLLAPVAVRAGKPVVTWHFSAEETSRLESHGGVHRDQPGPRPPEFPDFDAGNTSAKFDGRGSYFRLPDPGPRSPFDFDNGDSIGLEAYVQMSDIKAGENLYIVGKGRTHEKGFPRDNQNWALRVREVKGAARVSFLFFSAATKDRPGEWHRWTSDDGFKPSTGWHHVAVGYTFGKPASVRGWLDGKPTTGTWDMGGETTRAPVVDDDAVWIGSAQGGAASNSFRGWLDEVAVHRGLPNDDVMRKRFRPAAGVSASKPEPFLAAAKVVPGRVVFSLHEGWDAHDAFPDAAKLLPAPVTAWETDRFLLARMPSRYDDWGLRAAWKPTTVVRAASELHLPAGRHAFLIRGRGAARLWIDGRLVAWTPALVPAPDGHGTVPPDPKPPAEGCRLVAYGDAETIVDVTLSAGKHTVVFEMLAGGKKFRVESGGCCVAIRLQGETSFRLLSPTDDRVPMTEAGWEDAVRRQEVELTALDDHTRRQAATSQDGYWLRRRLHAREWARSHPASVAPTVASSWPVNNDIDRFLAAKMEAAIRASRQDGADREFYEKLHPVLEANCLRCHGQKARGGLKLDSRALALKGGESGKPAVVPGKPGESELLRRVRAHDDAQMPPGHKRLPPEQIALLEKWIAAGAHWPAPPARPQDVTPSPLTSDAAFLRRVFLDTVGVPPSPEEARTFLYDRSTDRRATLIRRLLDDTRLADHWVGYWQDVLAENPSLVKPSLNNSGPFRFFLYEALRDHKPMDRFVTELVQMRGAPSDGGSGGFALAADNDAPLAAKAQVLATAFLGVEMQCARCHDSPYHATKQRDLFRLAALLDRKPVVIPKSSSVPAAFFETKTRPSLIRASSRPGESMPPEWPFEQLAPSEVPAGLLRDPRDSRERLAALMTLPANARFPQVVVNRLWKRLMGAGLVEPAHDWEGREASHPELLAFLAHDFVANGYDARRTLEAILTSHAYQRTAGGNNRKASAETRFFAAPDRRRMSAEQVVDSLFAVADRPIDSEPLSFDADGRASADRFLNLGVPRRAWEFLSLSNERDRPSLALPRAQAVVDVLEAFGWNGARQSPLTDRESDANVLQPGILAHGVLSSRLVRLTDGSRFTRLALESDSPERLADALVLTLLSRPPTPSERAALAQRLAVGFDERLTGSTELASPLRPPRVSWTNHLDALANQQMLDYARAVRAGDPPTRKLHAAWRERAEDVVWSLVNLPEFVWTP